MNPTLLLGLVASVLLFAWVLTVVHRARRRPGAAVAGHPRAVATLLLLAGVAALLTTLVFQFTWILGLSGVLAILGWILLTTRLSRDVTRSSPDPSGPYLTVPQPTAPHPTGPYPTAPKPSGTPRTGASRLEVAAQVAGLLSLAVSVAALLIGR